MLWLALACADRSDPQVAGPALGRALPILAAMEARKVDFLRVQDWCRALSYDRGDFLVTSHASTCVLDQTFVPGTPFDPQADADADQWSSSLARAGIGVHWVLVDYDPAGAAVRVELALDTFARLSYQWSPTDPPVTEGSEIVVTPVAAPADWYVVAEDWN